MPGREQVGMMRAGRAWVVGVALVALAGCSGGGEADTDTDAGTDTGAEETTAPEEPAADATITVGDTSLGEVLVDAEGMALYMFDPDEQGESTCYDDCATAWPPLIADGEPTVGEGLDESLVGTVERTDGEMQVTYNDWPLYYWQNDEAPGDVTGQAVNEVWWVVGPDGEPVRTEPEAEETS